MTAPTMTSGRALLTAVRDGLAPPPPAASALGLDLLEVGDEGTTFGFHASPAFENGQGLVNGGILSAVADFAISTAAWATSGASSVVTTNLAVTFTAPVPADGRYLRCEGRVVHGGSRLVHATASMVDDEGRTVLTATGTCYSR